jgi:hypothetical protein
MRESYPSAANDVPAGHAAFLAVARPFVPVHHPSTCGIVLSAVDVDVDALDLARARRVEEDVFVCCI